jgi:ribosome maturation factor RimP
MQANEIIDLVNPILEQLLKEEPNYFCVQIKVKPTNNIKIFLDGDQGLPIEKCTFINRKLYRIMEEAAWFPEGDFSLEVSSPGIDEPLLLNRQYVKNIGRKVEVTFLDESIKEGILKTVTEKDKQRRQLFQSNELKRRQYKLIIENLALPAEVRAQAVILLNNLPRSSSPVRLRNRCALTGRSRGVLRKWRMSRVRFRELASQGALLGVSKSSW